MTTNNYNLQQKANIYNISFWSLLGWNYVISGILYLVGLIITVGIINPGYASRLMAGLTSSSDNIEYIVSAIFIQVLAGFFPILLMIYIFREDFIGYFKDLKKRPLFYVLLTIGLFIVGLILSGLVSILLSKIGIEGDSENQLFLEAAIKSNAAPLVFVAAVIQAPILEELIFRKTLFGMLEKKFRLNKIVTLVIATLFFALIHVVSELTSGDPMQMLVVLTYIPLSLTLGIAYIQTENLLIPMIIHFLNNVLAFLSVVGVINV